MHKKYWITLAIVASVAVGLGAVVAVKNKEASGGHPRNVLVPLAIQHNGEDLKFVRMMIPHHEAAIEMALQADGRGGQQVGQLATEVIRVHTLELGEMRQWLSEWGESGNDPASAGVASGQQELAGLKGASGGEFDQMFLSRMISHHQSAIEMAEHEQSAGRYAPAKELANRIIAAQKVELQEMRTLLNKS